MLRCKHHAKFVRNVREVPLHWHGEQVWLLIVIFADLQSPTSMRKNGWAHVHYQIPFLNHSMHVVNWMILGLRPNKKKSLSPKQNQAFVCCCRVILILFSCFFLSTQENAQGQQQNVLSQISIPTKPQDTRQDSPPLSTPRIDHLHHELYENSPQRTSHKSSEWAS